MIRPYIVSFVNNTRFSPVGKHFILRNQNSLQFELYFIKKHRHYLRHCHDDMSKLMFLMSIRNCDFNLS